MTDTLEFADDCPLPTVIRKRHDAFAYLMGLSGKRYRKFATRETLKIEIEARSYFIKKHLGVGWSEIFKNWLTFKCPVVSAQNEVDAIVALTRLGIPTTPYVAHGIQGHLPAHLKSFLITQDLGDIVTLEDLALAWRAHRPSVRYKRALIRRVAEIACTLHTHAIYHRDFYICHFCLKRKDIEQTPPPLHVLDLHRAVIERESNLSLQKKDLAALYFSAMDAGLNRGDRHHFLKHYTGLQGSELVNSAAFYEAVLSRAKRLYLKYQRKIRAGVAM